MSATSEKGPLHSSYPPQVPQNEESGWLMALKTIFWLLLLPSTLLLLLKWLMPS